MKQMLELYQHILSHGTRKSNRTGVDTVSVFGYQMRFDLRDGFPLVTRKFTSFRLIASELLWFLKGQQDKVGALEDLHAQNNHIWDEWAKHDGSFGPIYGVQWRRWGERLGHGGIDQIAWLVQQLKICPDSRRMIVTAWQPEEITDMALPPCHILFQLNTRPKVDGTLRVDLHLYQRSCDAFLGVPFNVASYALLLHMLVEVCGKGYEVGELVWTGGDVHLYVNHMEQVTEYLSRDDHVLPKLRLRHRDSIDDFVMEDLHLVGYIHSGKIAAPVAV